MALMCILQSTDYIQLAVVRDWLWALVKMVTNLKSFIKGKLLLEYLAD
jgi:hypothetical protein